MLILAKIAIMCVENLENICVELGFIFEVVFLILASIAHELSTCLLRTQI